MPGTLSFPRYFNVIASSRGLVRSWLAVVAHQLGAILFFWSGPLIGADATAPTRRIPIPVEDLFRSPSFRDVCLSPDGTHVAALFTDEKDASHLVVYNIATRTHKTLRATANIDVTSVQWLGNDRLAARLTESKLYNAALVTLPPDKPEETVAIVRRNYAEVVGFERSRPDRLLVWLPYAGRDSGLIELDSRHANSDRDRTLPVWLNPPKKGVVIGWDVDFDGALATATTYAEGRLRVHRYRAKERAWAELPFDPMRLLPEAVDPDGEHLWVVDTANGNRLRRYRFSDGVMDEPVRAEVEDVFATFTLFFSHRKRVVAGLVTTRPNKSVWWLPEYAEAMQAVDSAYPGAINRLVSVDDADQRFLFESSSVQDPGKHLLFDRGEGKIQVISTAAPWLAPYGLEAGETVTFSGRDGAQLDGTLTLPSGMAPPRGWPMVVLLRDGFWGTGRRTFEPAVQLFASRGFAVFQPNYRSTASQVPNFSASDLFDFQRMHEDITDGVQAMVARGKVDPARIAIIGAQIGASLAISGVALEPRLYRCAVGIGGLYDWEDFLRDKRFGSYADEYTVLADLLGKPGSDHGRLASISPLSKADRIRVPVFLAHGKKDRIISLNQSKKLAAVLKRNHVPYETFFRSEEITRFFNFRSRVALYGAVDHFLARYLAEDAAAKNP